MVGGPDPFGIEDTVLTLSLGRKLLAVVRSVLIDSRNKNAVHAFECIQRFAALSTSPNGIAGQIILTHRKNQGDVESHACCGQFLERIETCWRGRHFDHSIIVSSCPFFAEGDIVSHAFGMRHVYGRVFQKRIEFEADPTRVPFGPNPNGVEFSLCVNDQIIGHTPADGRVILPAIDIVDD